MTAWPSAYGLLTLAEVDSTNEEARRRAAAGETGPLWIAAERQSAGRGRRGRPWIAPPGNLSATLLIRPDRPPAASAQLSFVAALAVADMLAGLGVEAALKWPNDVLASGCKIAGILLESEAGAMAIGIGINLQAHPDDTETPATSVAALGLKAPSPQDGLAALAAAFAKWYEAWRTDGFAAIRAGWLARAHGLGGRIRVRLAAAEAAGIFRDIDETGALVLGLPGGATRTVTAGEVFFRG